MRKSGTDTSYIRVLLLNKGSIKLGSKSGFRIREKKSGKILYESRKKHLVIGAGKIKRSLLVESRGTPLSLNETPYRGMFELHNIVGKIYVINIVKMDNYLFSVVPSEIPASWDMQALKAQAVAARTYTYYHLLNRKKKKIYDLDASTNFQVYKGMSSEKPDTTRAVLETSGEILSHNHKPILAYFHSTCGGKTADDDFIWKGKGKTYLTGIKCNYCSQSPHYRWQEKLTLHEIKNSLSKKYRNIGKIRRISFTRRFGRVTGVEILHSSGKLTLSGNSFRLLFPPKKLKSMYFVSRKSGSGLLIRGRGWGHGVGLCQWGARGMAEKGANYRAILKHYYRNIRLVKINRKRIEIIAHKNSSGKKLF
jgi:stage II sporulation protein D